MADDDCAGGSGDVALTVAMTAGWFQCIAFRPQVTTGSRLYPSQTDSCAFIVLRARWLLSASCTQPAWWMACT
jgi:hypothetical protein